MKKKHEDNMRKEYDFSKSSKGKFFHSIDELEFPIYLDKQIKKYFYAIAKNRKLNLSTVINRILKKEMEIQKK